jgi:hypothetical protein
MVDGRNWRAHMRHLTEWMRSAAPVPCFGTVGFNTAATEVFNLLHLLPHNLQPAPSFASQARFQPSPHFAASSFLRRRIFNQLLPSPQNLQPAPSFAAESLTDLSIFNPSCPEPVQNYNFGNIRSDLMHCAHALATAVNRAMLSSRKRGGLQLKIRGKLEERG